ncbi:redoxin domain-containing protein [Pedobacter duraquae]|uniref:Uncharacterized protein (TIGR03435 family) n=1 Tax=Pedobacter duraquae TaxID=425511 RepID=A0A4R6INP4_9SPHI|nr:redoxin domain-containing protein [Pedobacter duraquae]TDO23862.1 uncharacterized protein (TIGR03435 family) [Pedobacter duraquae]
MKTLLIYLLFFLLSFSSIAQGFQIKPGDQFPNIPITGLLNSPVATLRFTKQLNKKIYILNFWGTWCSPCIPEMDALAKLQSHNNTTIQVVAISNDAPSRLLKYMKIKPSRIWLASDTSALLYQLFSLSYVGQSAIVNAKGKVVAIVKTESINQQMINDLVSGKSVKSSAEIKEKPVNNNADIFAVDSTLSQNFTLRGYMKGQQSMEIGYGDRPVFKNRRLTFINSSIEGLFRNAYGIVSPKQVAYEIPEKLVYDFEDKQTLYCLDLLVKSTEKDSLYQIFKERLQQFMPVQARIEMRQIPVYALIDKGFHQNKSADNALSYSFSGAGFDGTGVKLEDFANEYLSNEFDLPVVDETGLAGRYDFKTNVAMRTRTGVMKSVNDIGLDLVKKTKMMPILVFYKDRVK